jgi:PAS domain S-box-containing protein
MSTPLHVLLIEDSEIDALMIVRELKRNGYEPVFERVERAEAFTAALEKQTWDIILADHKLPQFSDVEALQLVQEQGLDIPFIIVSGTIGEEAAVAAMKAGAYDYVLKDNLARLVPAVRRALEEAELRRKAKETEEARRQAEERYRLVVENAGEAILVVQDEKIKFYNAAAERLFGYGPETVPADYTYLDVIHPEDRDQVRERYRQRMEGDVLPYRYIYRFFDRQGRMHWGEINSVFLPWEGRPASLVFINDITERKLAEEQIIKAKEEWERTFDSVPDLIAIVDKEFRVTRVNRAMADRLDLTPREMIGKRCYELFHGQAGPPAYCPHNAVIQENRGKAAEFFEPRLNGYFFLTATPLPGTESVIHVFRDISDRKRAEEKILQGAEQLRKAMTGIVQTMAATVEVKDPYTAGHQRRVADLAQAIAAEMGLDENQCLGIHMAGMIHDLGKLSVPAEILSKPTPLTEIEMNLIRVHLQAGYEILKGVEFPWPVARMILEHHERINGSGYPQGLKGEAISPEARILAVADVVEAIASFRPYRPARGIETALQEIEAQQGILYDAQAVQACLRLFREKGYRLG